ncbi:MAG: methyltransferase domain-containing protein [Chloroflexota bacterium]|nr:methyltransferase domain-containing protein [Chloroflexota bacterium]
MTDAGREWDAASYHRVADPHVDWGRAVLDRLPLRGDETVIDAGCGTGRLTELLLERLPDGRVLAIDRSANMLAQAEAHLRPRFGDRVTYLQADLGLLDLDGVADGVFSTATFHWLPDHPRLFTSLFRALRPGGRLVAQCGGGPNIARLRERLAPLMASEPFAPYFAGWPGPWTFADAAETADRLHAAGFVDVATDVIPAPTTLPDEARYREFLATVVLGTHLDRLPDDASRERFLDPLVAAAVADDPPFTLDYWRLNLQGRRPPS